MSFLKFWGASKSGGKSKKEKENSQPKSKWPELTPEEQAEAEKFPFQAGKRDKNLSMSRSGRYKYKAKQRGALVGQEEDLYSTHRNVPGQSSSSSQGSASNHNHAPGSYGAKHDSLAKSNNSNQGSLGRSNNSNQGSLGRSSNSNQGSLGRSSAGGQCAVEESTKRYPGQTKISRHPTAV